MRDFIIALDGDKPQAVYLLQAFMGNMAANRVNVIPLLGMYRGVGECSFLVAEEDMDTWKPWCANRESWLVVSRCNKQYANLYFPATGHTEALGCMMDVTAERAAKERNWTYCPSREVYWITGPESQHTSVAERQERELWAAIDRVVRAACDPAMNTAQALAALKDVRLEQRPKHLAKDLSEYAKQVVNPWHQYE